MRQHPSRTFTRAAAPLAAVVLVLGLAACGSDEEAGSSTAGDSTSSDTSPGTSSTPGGSGSGGSGGSGGGSSAAEDAMVIEVTIADGEATPKGDRVEVGVGQEVVLDITADEAGELHVHTTEELDLPFPEGESQQTLVVDQPGVVDVESHDLDQVIVQLQVS